MDESYGFFRNLKQNKYVVVTLLRFMELLFPTVLLSVGYSLCLQYGIIKLPVNKVQSLLFYHSLSFAAAVYFVFNFIMTRISYRFFILISGNADKTDTEKQAATQQPFITSDLKGYYLTNYIAVVLFAIFPLIARYVYDQTLYRWIFGITNCFKLSAAGINYSMFSSVSPIFSILLFIVILLLTVPAAQIGVGAKLIRSINSKQAERTERLAAAEQSSMEHRQAMTQGAAFNIYDVDMYDELADETTPEQAAERRRFEEASKQLRAQGSTEALDIYAIAGQSMIDDAEDERDRQKREAEEKSRQLREAGAKQPGIDIYAMAAQSDSDDDMSDEEREKEELSRRLREEGAKAPDRVDIYSGVREIDKKRMEQEENQS